MNNTPAALKKKLQADPMMGVCLRRVVFKDHECLGRITWEHALKYQGRQVQEVWAIIPLCEYAHSVGAYQDSGILDKRKNEYLALSRATDQELIRYARGDFMDRRERLIGQYGHISELVGDLDEEIEKEANEKRRTVQQNKAMHLLFSQVAETLNEAGLDMRTVLDPGIELPWSRDAVKEYLWRPIQKEMLRKKSTTTLSTKDIDRVFDVLNAHLGKSGVHVPFPSIEEIINQQR